MTSDIHSGTGLLGPAESDAIRIATVPGPEVQSTAPAFTAAPGSVVVVRDEEWLVTTAEPATDGWLVDVRGLSELVRDTEATFYTGLDTSRGSTRPTGGRRRRLAAVPASRLWLEAMLRKTPVPSATRA